MPWLFQASQAQARASLRNLHSAHEPEFLAARRASVGNAAPRPRTRGQRRHASSPARPSRSSTSWHDRQPRDSGSRARWQPPWMARAAQPPPPATRTSRGTCACSGARTANLDEQLQLLEWTGRAARVRCPTLDHLAVANEPACCPSPCVRNRVLWLSAVLLRRRVRARSGWPRLTKSRTSPWLRLRTHLYDNSLGGAGSCTYDGSEVGVGALHGGGCPLHSAFPCRGHTLVCTASCSPAHPCAGEETLPCGDDPRMHGPADVDIHISCPTAWSRTFYYRPSRQHLKRQQTRDPQKYQ
jgi:hypothetical protein